MMDCDVSIVIPVFNTKEELLRNCLSSVLRQTYKEIEILLIDDGSAPAVHELCDTLASQDNRIRVIHQDNKGVSAARNNGISVANGKYIMFVDSDDVLTKYAIEEGMSAIASSNADYVFAGLKSIKAQSEFNDECTTPRPEIKVFSADKVEYIMHVFITQQVKDDFCIKGGYINRGPCARLIRSSIVKDVLFDTNLPLGEDVEWNMRVLSRCGTICFVNSVWYGYVYYATSSLHKYYGNRAELLERYHLTLYSNNIEYFENHKEDYAINMATSFMLLIRTEFLSENCPLTKFEKKIIIKELLKKEPWCIITQKNMQKTFSKKYRVLINSCKNGYGLLLFSIWERMFH